MAPTNIKTNNILPLWGNEKTMNLNNLILTNIQSSHYFKINLFELKTYHEVIDEIYYKVNHMEPWEKGSRKTSGQTGMCGGVRGVGAGGIVSTAFCLLYKLFTLKLTRKQLNGLITHCDSPYIRSLGFMYIRYTQPPADLWDWFEAYLDDEEELDVKAGGGCVMTVGEMLRHFLSKLEWYSTLFPRIPVPIQKDIEKKLGERPLKKMGPAAAAAAAAAAAKKEAAATVGAPPPTANSTNYHLPSTGDRREKHITDDEVSWGEAERISRLRRSASRERKVRKDDRDVRHERHDARNGSEHRDHKDKDRERARDRRDHQENGGSERSWERERHRRDKERYHKDRRRSRSGSRNRDPRSHKDHQHRSRSRSRDQQKDK